MNEKEQTVIPVLPSPQWWSMDPGGLSLGLHFTQGKVISETLPSLHFCLLEGGERWDVRFSVACVCLQICHVKHLRACPGQGKLLIRLDKMALTRLTNAWLRLRKGQLLSNITLFIWCIWHFATGAKDSFLKAREFAGNIYAVIYLSCIHLILIFLSLS